MREIAAHPAENEAGHQTVCETNDNSTDRTCIACGELKALDEFAKDSSKARGRRNSCTSCRAAYDRERDYIRRCLKYGHRPVVGHFTTAQLVERYGDSCVDCGGPFECIDHRVCVRVGGPHTLDNVVPCCRRCNVRKRGNEDAAAIWAYRQSVAVAA